MGLGFEHQMRPARRRHLYDCGVVQSGELPVGAFQSACRVARVVGRRARASDAKGNETAPATRLPSLREERTAASCFVPSPGTELNHIMA